ncbi:Trigger factor [Morus notabilis]|uniref:peptidylprolyl isomerase n=1 Tax=Morus notabilis TaxID=981085 RepID=W9R5W6_9ROSA|nr:Trigger factor [Morus notabilis]
MEMAIKTHFLGSNPQFYSSTLWNRDFVQNHKSAKDVEVSSSQFEGFLVSTSSGVTGPDELKISVEVSGTITRELYDKVFDKMVADAQPIPGFRRVKGGELLIPKDILLEVLGPSKVIKQVIKKIINSTIAEYVDKEGLKVSKDLRVEQSFEDLESTFEAGETFNFDAILQLQEIK